MRLIDADALENDTCKVLKKSYTFSTHTFLALHMMLDIIKGRETIRAEPVKHGKWLDTRRILCSVRCSVCGGCFSNETLYCPNCGAKMDGGVKDDSKRIS